MVHALKEAWRVLVPDGIMIDVRPLTTDVPIEVVFAGGSQPAGMVDLSPERELDRAADEAIEAVVEEGRFHLNTLETFDYANYWRTYHGMVTDFSERWEGEIIVPDQVLRKARQLYEQNRPGAKLRLPMKMKMGAYQREEI